MARASSDGDGTSSGEGTIKTLDLDTRWAALRDFVNPYWQRARPYLPPINFITVHHAYFIFVGLLVAAIFHGVSKNEASIPTVDFTDSWFLVVSAFTGTGLNTIDLADLATGQQVALFIMMIAGSPILVSLFTIWFRVRIFEKRFDGIVELERERRRQQQRATGIMVGMAGALFALPIMSSFQHNDRSPAAERPSPMSGLNAKDYNSHSNEHVHFADEPQRTRVTAATPTTLEPLPENLPLPPTPGVPSTPGSPLRPRASPRFVPPPSPGRLFIPSSPMHRTSPRVPPSPGRFRPISRQTSLHTPSGNKGPTFDFRTFVNSNRANIGRNGQFFDLNDDQREYLGGVEYRALKLLFGIVGAYFVLFQVAGCLILGGWMSVRGVEAAAVNNQDPWWTGVFLASSAFHCIGFTLLDAGIAAYTDDGFVLAVVTMLSFAGGVAFPVCIRFTVWLCRLIFKHGVKRYGPSGHDYDAWLEAFDFVLKYPRRLFMLMFPSRANLIFATFLSTLTATNWFLMLILGKGNAVLEAFGLAKRVGLTLFQATTMLATGFAAFSPSGLWPDTQLLLLIIMYLAAYPEIIVMRNSNVYEERSLGLYTSDEASKQDAEEEEAEKAADSLAATLLPTFNISLPHLTPALSRATAVSTASQPIRTLATVGRRGTAFVGKQIVRRMNDFQGVGVDARPAKLQRAKLMHFDGTATPGANNAVGMAQDGGINLVSQHLRGQLSHDVWSIALGLFFICAIETSHTIEAPMTYSVFNILFEVMSSYANIGISMGLPDSALSFSGGWYEGSKIVLILLMLRGRHRGLPVALDHSVKLPGWDDAKKEDEDAQIRRSVSRVRASIDVQ